MNFICLSPHFPPNFRNFWLRLAQNGVNVLGLADSPWQELGEPLQSALREYFMVGNMHQYDQLVRAVGHFTYRHGKIDRIESHNEYWLETEADLRTDFNITGPKRDSIARVKRKSLMKQVFRDVGVAVAEGGVVTTLAEAEKLVATIGYPVIIKPDIGVGAAGTSRANNHDELREFFETSKPGEYMLEEFISGLLCSYDGLVDADGNIVFSTSHVFNQGIMEIVQSNGDMYYYSLRDIPADLEEAGKKSVAAFDLRDRFFHIEFFRCHTDQRLVAVEVNMRPPGGITTDLFNFANDFDIYTEYAHLITRGRFEAKWSRPYHALYIGRKDHIAYRHSYEEVLQQGQGLVVHVERVQSAFARAIGDAAIVARSPELDSLLALTRYALET